MVGRRLILYIHTQKENRVGFQEILLVVVFFFLKSLLLKILLKYALLENLFQELLQGYPYKHRLYRSSIFKEINWPDLERFKTELKKFFSPSK